MGAWPALVTFLGTLAATFSLSLLTGFLFPVHITDNSCHPRSRTSTQKSSQMERRLSFPSPNSSGEGLLDPAFISSLSLAQSTVVGRKEERGWGLTGQVEEEETPHSREQSKMMHCCFHGACFRQAAVSAILSDLGRAILCSLQHILVNVLNEGMTEISRSFD